MVASTAVAHRIPAGWYRDKDDPSRRRWWDGIEWTEHYAPVTDSLTTNSLAIDAPDAGEPTRAESADPRMPALLESIGSRVERMIAPQPEQPERHEAGSTGQSGQLEHAVHSSEIPIARVATTATTRRRVPLAIIVLLAGLTGANTVLLAILLSGR